MIAAGGTTALVEFWLTGTHLGPLRLNGQTIPPKGKHFRVRIAGSFEFEPGSDRVICERPYFDQRVVARALELT